MKSLTIAMPYYENPAMLLRHQEEWAAYPAELRDRLHVVIVDDGSPGIPASEVLQAPDGYVLELYRIKEDKPWNQNGARNLALDRAPDGPVLMTDIDHLLGRDMAPGLFATELEHGYYYVLGRRLPTGLPYHPHPNSYLMERALFWEVGGASEDFAGYYGSDCVFRRRIVDLARRWELRDVCLTVYNLAGVDIGGIEGAATRSWGRKKTRWHARGVPGVRDMLRRAHLAKPERPLRFEWERVR